MRFLIFLFALFPFTSTAQTGPIQIHLSTGNIVSTQYAYLYSSSGFSEPYVRIHDKKGEKISIDRVHHIEGTDQHGKYRYFKPISTEGRDVWAERSFISDRIEIYHTDIVTGSMSTLYKPKNCLYSKDGGLLKSLKLKNLKRDLADCPDALVHLKKGKAVATTQTAFYTVGYTLVAVGIVDFIGDMKDSEVSDNPEEDTGASIPPLLIAGAAMTFVPLLINGIKRDHYLEALKAYK